MSVSPSARLAISHLAPAKTDHCFDDPARNPASMEQALLSWKMCCRGKAKN